ncbi:cilium assembly protein DZIP1 isoform X2 [Bacillus rossius redtenbacheri]|uniref:cilium assembly protein DZIP1 isoform X2 n=1 Tax=Bacillus rossius redtenbacheri TaxID=93214 RepID=UPI002FDEBAE4
MKESFTKTLKCCANPEEFPKLAKEMGFSFHLRRGRVNWHKIDAIDVDRLIQERDVATLQENLASIINYSLDAEYDVKILDPSFVKLFRLAQLSIDYLMYSEQHVYNCVQLAQDEILKLSAEVQRLRKECRKKDLDQKNLKKRMKSLERLRPSDSYLYDEQATSGAGLHFQCRLCGKVFRTWVFLEQHHGRRHAGQPGPPAPGHAASLEAERLQLEVKELKERLNLAERLLLQEREGTGGEKLQETQVKYQDDRKIWEEESKRRMEEWQQNEQKKYREELTALQEKFLVEIQHVKEQSKACSVNSELAENVQKQEEKLSLLQEELGKKLSPGVRELQAQLEAQEQLWRSRLGELEQRHRGDLRDLAARLGSSEAENAKMISAYESKILSLTAHVKEQELTLRSQGEQIKRLTSQPQPRQAVQPSVSPAPVRPSPVRPTGNSARSFTPVRPLLADEPPERRESPEAPGMTAVTPAEQRVLHAGSVHSSRDSGLDSPRRMVHPEPEPREHERHRGQQGSEESASDETSESSESASQQKEEDDVVPVPSLQEALALNPDILTELRGDMRDILERRLRELGIDPEWEGIPAATFRKKMATVEHHQTITAKRYADFFAIKESLMKEVNSRVAVHKKGSPSAVSKRVSGLNARSRVAKMVGNVRSRALGVVQRSGKNKPRKGRNGMARTTRSAGAMMAERKRKGAQQVSSDAVLGGRDGEPAQRLQPAASQRGETVLPARSGDFAREVPAVTSTPVKPPAAVPTSSTTVLKSYGGEEGGESPPSSSQDDDESEASDSGSWDRKTVKVAGSGQPAQRPAASVGNLADRKKVLFGGLGSAADVKTAASDTSANPTRTTVDNRFSEAGPAMVSKQKAARTVKFSDEIRPQETKDETSDSDDLDISSIEDFKADTKSDHTAGAIRLSTKQSDKIAQISKNIEHQLNLTRKKPVGGVETMFGAGGASSGTAAGGDAGQAKPLALETLLADWDLEDFDELSNL